MLQPLVHAVSRPHTGRVKAQPSSSLTANVGAGCSYLAVTSSRSASMLDAVWLPRLSEAVTTRHVSTKVSVL